jgi:parallel beta-helix repeat protein
MRNFLFIFMAMLSTNALASDWYVDGKNGNNGSSGTIAAPFLTPSRGVNAAYPGDTVHFLPTIVYPFFGIFKSGTAKAPITLRGDGVAPNLTQIRANSANFGIQVNTGASYINVQNFDVSAGAGRWSGIFVGQGSHHVTVSGNVVHDNGVSGIQTTHADYLTIVNNELYRNSNSTSNGAFGSGISVYESTDIDSNTGVKIIIDSNIAYNNTNTPTVGVKGGLDSDGNGIILDDSNHSQSLNAPPPYNLPYRGTTLIQNNIAYNNGGRGINVYNSDHAIVVNNTAFYNNQDPYEGCWRPGEITVEGAGGDISIYNNILYSDGAVGTANTGPHVGISIEDATDGIGSLTVDYNLIYNPQSNKLLQFFQKNNTNYVVVGLNNLWQDPLFMNASIGPQFANFQVSANSPSIGTANENYIPNLDIDGDVRPVNGPFDMGAYK